MTTERILRINEVSARVGLGVWAIRDRIEAGRFPTPAIREHRNNGWPEREIDRYIDLQLDGTTAAQATDEIHAARAVRKAKRAALQMVLLDCAYPDEGRAQA